MSRAGRNRFQIRAVLFLVLCFGICCFAFAKEEAKTAQGYYQDALTSWQQLKSLEETQNWDEYFAKGNDLRQVLESSLENAIAKSGNLEPVRLESKLLLWKFHASQQDTFTEGALIDLMNTAADFAKQQAAPEILKHVADELSANGEKAQARAIYKMYVDNLLKTNVSQEILKEKAGIFYKENNFDFSETLYDAYLEKLANSGIPKEKIVAELFEVAGIFVYKDNQPNDPAYAEKVFEKIEQLAGRAAFNEDQLYLRAFNLEKQKEYRKARDIYIQLLEAYPQTSRADKINYKLAVINLYVLKDINNARVAFEKLAEKDKSDVYAPLSLYQLGVISQWQQDAPSAKKYYTALIEKAGGNFSDISTRAGERLKEIEQARPMEYNLRVFMDACLKEGYVKLEAGKVDLASSLYLPKPDQQINIKAGPELPTTGCMEVQLQYFWSGDTGNFAPTALQPVFNTNFSQKGTKTVSLVVVSPTGTVDSSFIFIDVE